MRPPCSTVEAACFSSCSVVQDCIRHLACTVPCRVGPPQKLTARLSSRSSISMDHGHLVSCLGPFLRTCRRDVLTSRLTRGVCSLRCAGLSSRGPARDGQHRLYAAHAQPAQADSDSEDEVKQPHLQQLPPVQSSIGFIGAGQVLRSRASPLRRICIIRCPTALQNATTACRQKAHVGGAVRRWAKL